MEKPQISVIIPVYNVARYLPRCIDSLLAQTFSDFELILVDDGAQDESGVICDRYAQMDTRIRVIHQINSGTMMARHNGYMVARGEYLIFCDSDDTMPTYAFDTLWRAITEQNVDVVFGAHTILYASGKSKIKSPKLPSVLTLEHLQRAMLHYELFCMLCCNIFKRTLFTDYTYHIPSSLLHEDRLMLIQILCNCTTFGCVDKPVYDYYQNDSSITRNRLSEEKLKGSLSACEWQIEFMNKQGICLVDAEVFYLKYMNWLLEHGYSKQLIVEHSSVSSLLYSRAKYSTLLSQRYSLHTMMLKASWVYRQCCCFGRELVKYYREYTA